MIPFDLAEPTSLSDAVKLLNPDDPTIRPIAGGTALMLMMKAGVYNPEKLISLRKIEGKYSTIAAGADGLRIGAMTTLGALERSDEVRKSAPLISRTFRTPCRMSASATSPPSAARWPTAIRTWTCRRC